MTVAVPAGMQANWYNQSVGGTALVSNSLSYTHTNGLPGVYNYYVETYDPANGCFSLTRLAIQVEIFANPFVPILPSPCVMMAILDAEHSTSMGLMAILLHWQMPFLFT